ncbi:hypothetical protein LE197_06260 [Pseudomonas sp. PS1(2021)]|uniref:DUF7740 domain-containing protein n=1 Tax=Pseudomonas sp. PS1(2021) TaxID=2866282 RepID=UPI001CEFC389|nr:hypothetical protein [Pseudomonas sp. PS1(2021)]UCM29501.1 hypothetical protein LE197_06260 [Pseudomonas sp. PS1(2021)]
MSVDDALLLLLLAEKIHGTDSSIRRVAKKIAKKVPRSRRDVLYKLIDSKSPLGQIRYIAMNIDEQTRRRLAAR